MQEDLMDRLHCGRTHGSWSLMQINAYRALVRGTKYYREEGSTRKEWKKELRETQTLRALAVVRDTARPPAQPPLQTLESQTRPITIHCAAKHIGACIRHRHWLIDWLIKLIARSVIRIGTRVET